MTTNQLALRPVTADLWETASHAPFPGLTTHAYLWTGGPAGNVLFYSPGTDDQFDELERHGGVAEQYLSHRDEAGPMLVALARRFGTRVHAPAVEIRDIGRHHQPDVVFSEPGSDALGVEIVPTPGHSPGSTCFVVAGASGRYLFTGDTLYRSEDGSWTAGLLPGLSDAVALDRSLELLGGLEPDLVISSAFTGESAFQRFAGDEWRSCIALARQGLAAAAR